MSKSNPPCKGSNLAREVRDVDEVAKVGYCCVCGKRVKVYRNENDKWEPEQHPG